VSARLNVTYGFTVSSGEMKPSSSSISSSSSSSEAPPSPSCSLRSAASRKRCPYDQAIAQSQLQANRRGSTCTSFASISMYAELSSHTSPSSSFIFRYRCSSSPSSVSSSCSESCSALRAAAAVSPIRPFLRVQEKARGGRHPITYPRQLSADP